MITLGVSALVVLLYFFAQQANATNSRRQPQNPVPPLQGYGPHSMSYQPQPMAMEEQASGLSFWPILALAGIAAIFYLGYRSTPAKTTYLPSRSDTPTNTKNRTSGQFDYGHPDKEVYFIPKEERPEYTVPLSTPRTNTRRGERRAVEPYEYSTEKEASGPTTSYEAPDYRQGYGVQLFATEKGWWEEAHVREIQRNYHNHLLLIGTGYTSEQVQVNKFLLGPFNTKAEASQFARQIGKAFPGAFAVDLSKLEQVRRYWAVP